MQVRLTTIGARSGEPRTVTLYAWEDGARLIVVGSWGGAACHPAWVHNLRAHPLVTVVRGREAVEMTATEITEPDERDRVWRLVVDRFPMYATYQGRTKRLIPLFALQPEAATTGA